MLKSVKNALINRTIYLGHNEQNDCFNSISIDFELTIVDVEKATCRGFDAIRVKASNEHRGVIYFIYENKHFDVYNNILDLPSSEYFGILKSNSRI